MVAFEKVSYNDKGTIPTRGDYGSAGHDFYLVDDLKINPGETALVPTYIKARMNNDVVLLLYVRSSIGIKKHLMLSMVRELLMRHIITTKIMKETLCVPYITMVLNLSN